MQIFTYLLALWNSFNYIHSPISYSKSVEIFNDIKTKNIVQLHHQYKEEKCKVLEIESKSIKGTYYLLLTKTSFKALVKQ